MTEYRLKALDKSQVRWPLLDLFAVVAIAGLTYLAVARSVAK